MSGQSPNRPTVTEILVDRLQGPISAADREKAAFCVLDWAGCAAAGAKSPAAEAMREGLIGNGSLADVLYWGALGNVLEMDDVDKRAILHPGPVVIAAALAAAQSAGATAEQFLNGVVRGYEAVIRIGRAVGPDHYRYWHNTGTCGPFGAAAAAASIFNLDIEKTVWALGLAGTQASGFWQMRNEPQSFAKQLHTARAAHAGLLAAQLAGNGFVGLRTVLEGPQGFFAATCGDADPSKVVDFESNAWAIHDVSVKPWPACRHAHAVIDAALVLRNQGVKTDDIQSVLVRSYKDALVFCDKPKPKDSLSAKFSLQHSAAITFLRGEPRLEDFEEKVLSEPAVVELRQKITVEEDEAITARYPARFGAGLDVVLKNGEKRTIEIPDALGDPENPAPREMILDKAKMLMAAGGVSGQNIDALIQSALALSSPEGSFEEFLELLKAEALS